MMAWGRVTSVGVPRPWPSAKVTLEPGPRDGETSSSALGEGNQAEEPIATGALTPDLWLARRPLSSRHRGQMGRLSPAFPTGSATRQLPVRWKLIRAPHFLAPSRGRQAPPLPLQIMLPGDKSSGTGEGAPRPGDPQEDKGSK